MSDAEDRVQVLARLIRLAEADRTWVQYARCRGLNPELFYPARGEATAEAKAICAGCPAREPCLHFALELGEKHGIWGGLSERERRRIRKARLAEQRARNCPENGSVLDAAEYRPDFLPFPDAERVTATASAD